MEQFLYSEGQCNALDHCHWNATEYRCSIQIPSDITVPPLSGGSSHDPGDCDDATFNAIENSLQNAIEMCYIAHRQRRVVNDGQIECLEFFLAEAGPQYTVANTCPCLWKFAIDVEPERGHWLEIDC